MRVLGLLGDLPLIQPRDPRIAKDIWEFADFVDKLYDERGPAFIALPWNAEGGGYDIPVPPFDHVTRH